MEDVHGPHIECPRTIVTHALCDALDAHKGATQEFVPNPLKVTLEKLSEDTSAKAEVATTLEELTDDQPAS